MKILSLFLTLTALTLISECSSYRILAIYPFNGKSHAIVLEAIAKSLVKHGHQIDVVTHFPLKKPVKNYNDIVNLDGTLDGLMNNYTIEFASNLRDDLTELITNLYGNQICDLMGHEGIQKLVKNPPKDPPYDIVLVEAFCANCFMGLGYVFNVPVVAISSAIEYPWISNFIGNDDNLSFTPNTFFNKVGKLSYWDRAKNFLIYFIELHKFHRISEDYQTKAMRKYLSPDIPNIREVEKNVALTLVNSNPILFGVKPLTPSLIQIAGLHVEQNDDTLTPELKKWMDESKHGVVYFTLGSMVLIESLPTEQLKEIYAAFEKIAPIKVLVKIVNATKLPPGLPKNVKTLPWVPQIPVLAHPNTKLFITHGGLGGIIEALYYGIPMIGMPLFSDQFRNCEIFVAKNMLVQIDFKQFSGKLLDSALQTVLQNPIYKQKAMYYSKLFRDQPMSPSKSVNYWIEYVIRNGPVLRSPALDYTWWQLAMIDVYALFLGVFIAILLLLILIVKMIVRVISKIFRFKTNKKKKSQ